MTWNEQLSALRAQMAREQELSALQQELEGKLSALQEQVRQLDTAREREQRDVASLEGGLKRLLYSAVGKLPEKQEKEQSEADAAQAAYAAALQALSNLQAELQAVKDEASSLYGCAGRYERTLEQKAQALSQLDTEPARQLKELDDRRSALQNQKKQLREAVLEGTTARRNAERLLKYLKEAEGWGTYDMLGGGMVSALAKHSKLDEAAEAARDLQRATTRFYSELRDVQNDLPDLSFSQSWRTADLMFDHIYIDWKVLSKIQAARDRADAVYRRIVGAMDALVERTRKTDRLLEETAQARRALIEGADL